MSFSKPIDINSTQKQWIPYTNKNVVPEIFSKSNVNIESSSVKVPKSANGEENKPALYENSYRQHPIKINPTSMTGQSSITTSSSNIQNNAAYNRVVENLKTVGGATLVDHIILPYCQESTNVTVTIDKNGFKNTASEEQPLSRLELLRRRDDLIYTKIIDPSNDPNDSLRRKAAEIVSFQQGCARRSTCTTSNCTSMHSNRREIFLCSQTR